MAIRFSCACGKEMQAQDEHTGRKTKCPGCGVELMIPGRSTQMRPPQGPKASRSSDRGVEYEDDDKIAERPARKAGRMEDDAEEDRTGGRPTARTSGKAIFCLILGLMSFGCNVFTAVPAVILGFLSLRDVGAGKGRVTGKGLAITGIAMGLIGLFCNDSGIGGGFGIIKLKDASQRQGSANNLKQIGLGMHNFASTHQRLPAIAIQTNGKPALSWRVALLPYLEQDNLYRQFKLDEPWDSAHNKRLLTPMPKVFAHPAASDATTAAGKTHYRAFYGTGAVFDPAVTLPQQGGGPTLGIRFPADIQDGTGNTIMVVEAADPIEWTKPDDLRFDLNALLPKLGLTDDGFNVLLADGSVRFIKKPVDEKMIKAAITRNGGEIEPLP